MRGVELQLAGAVTDDLDVLVGAAFNDAEITRSTSGQQGNRPYGVPEFQASFWGSYDLSALVLPGLSAALGVVHVGTREGDNDNSFELPDYTRVDLAATYLRGNAEFRLGVENLFDTTYYLGSQNRPSNIVPGAPLNVTAALRIVF